MSVLVLLEAQMKAPDEVEKLLREEIGKTRAYDGCEGLTIHRNLDDTNTLVLVERWETRGHYEKYLAWREERGDLDRFGKILEGPPSIRYFSTVGI